MVEWGHAHHLGLSSVKHSDSGLCAVTMSISRCSEGNTAYQQDSIKRLLCSGGLLNTPRSCPHSCLEPVLFGALGDKVGVKLWMRLNSGSYWRLRGWAPQSPGASIYYSSSIAWLGEGNGIPLQYCCPENPMDGGAW